MENLGEILLNSVNTTTKRLGVDTVVTMDVIESTIENSDYAVLCDAVKIIVNEEVDNALYIPATLYLQSFHLQAVETQKIRNGWDKAMDENDPTEMYVDKEGHVVFE